MVVARVNGGTIDFAILRTKIPETKGSKMYHGGEGRWEGLCGNATVHALREKP